MKVSSFSLLAVSFRLQAEYSAVLAKTQEPTCPCWSKEQLEEAAFPQNTKYCRVMGYNTYVGKAAFYGDPGDTLHFGTAIPLVQGNPVCNVKNATWPVGRWSPFITLEEFDVCSKQIAEMCSYSKREKKPAQVCPCWPLGLSGPLPPVTYQKCHVYFYPTYELLEDSYPCDDRLPQYDFACGGGSVTNEASNPRCRVPQGIEQGLAGTWVSITPEQYEACRTDILDDCDAFAERRFDVKPPKGGAMGDPHFKRFHHDKRDSFHGECDLVLLSSARAELDIHIRTTLVTYYSFIEQVAIRLGRDVLEFHANAVFVNGRQPQLEADFPITLGGPSGAQIYETEPDGITFKKSRRYKIDWKNGLSIVIKATKKFMAVSLEGDTRDLEDAVGMLGDYQTGEMYDRQGHVMQDFGDFGMEWQVTPDVDGLFFLENRQPQLPFERCRLPSIPRTSGEGAETTSRRLLRERQIDSKLQASAIEACETLHPEDFELCVDDVLMTGDIEIAYAW